MKISSQSIVLTTILFLTTAISAKAQQARIYDFQCAQGRQFRATFLGDRAIVQLNQSLILQQVRTASGIRYQAGEYIFSSKGNHAELTHNNQPLYQNCTGTMISPASETISGTVSYRERIALPPDTIVRVTLESVGAPMEVLAEQTIETQGRQVPIPFSLTYDAANLQEEASYVIRAQILVDQQLRFSGEATYPTVQKPAKVEVIVRSITPPDRIQACRSRA
ncbi:MAG: YbaY family lipoprotein [Leptolyngbya sp. Prado105]|jgi:putative lipoprotein|nr:YbaY family lipoprotein [Leptolyngbya sp. Prado105]